MSTEPNTHTCISCCALNPSLKAQQANRVEGSCFLNIFWAFSINMFKCLNVCVRFGGTVQWVVAYSLYLSVMFILLMVLAVPTDFS